jgi:hypothetical protein
LNSIASSTESWRAGSIEFDLQGIKRRAGLLFLRRRRSPRRHAGFTVEIEFARRELAVVGQALAEGVETVGLGLQLANPGSQRVNLTLRIFLRGNQLDLLVV